MNKHRQISIKTITNWRQAVSTQADEYSLCPSDAQLLSIPT